MNLLELADRCEAATGPDRELSNAIAVADGYCLHKNTTRSGAQSDTGFDCDDCGADSWGNKSKNGKGQTLYGGVPRFTASLDAAMTLVPEGWEWTVESGGHAELLASRLRGPFVEGNAATPALALCAAALRARASQDQSQGEKA